MSEPLWVRAYRAAFGVLTVAALIVAYTRNDDGTANYLSKFTYQSNAVAALVLLGGAALSASTLASLGWERLRGATVMYLVTTFVVYGLLIDGFDNPLTTDKHWTHTVLHQLVPAVVVLDVVLRPLRHRVGWPTIRLWMVYPLAFLAYSLVRGAITGWYPYDFIDPDEAGGYGGVALYAVGIAAGFLGMALLVAWLSNRRARASMAPVAPATRA